jgi:hypothetical protein
MRSIILHHIIYPHGITDLIHAYQEKGFGNLLKTYTSCFFIGYPLQKYIPWLYQTIFFIASIAHFRHDFGKDKKNWLYSIGNMLFFSQLPSECFLLYMSLIHVPQHYIRQWTVISNSPLLSCVAINTMGIVSTLSFFSNESILSFVILGHILYEEQYLY